MLGKCFPYFSDQQLLKWYALNKFICLFTAYVSTKYGCKGLIPRALFLSEMRKFSREIIVRMRDEDK